MTTKSNAQRLKELSNDGLLKWKETLKTVQGSESSFHYGSDAQRVSSDWRPTLAEVEEEIERRGLN